MYKDIAQDVGGRALEEMARANLAGIPPVFRSTVKMALQWAGNALKGLSEEAAETLINGAISALEEIKKRVQDEREKRGLPV